MNDWNRIVDTPDPEDAGVVGVSDETTVFRPVAVAGADDAETDRVARPKWLIPAIACGVGLLALMGVGGGYAVALRNVTAGVGSATAWNTESFDRLTSSLKDASTLLEETGEDTVDDPHVLDGLSDAADAAKNMTAFDMTANRLLVWELLDAENACDESTTRILAANDTLDTAMNKMKDSVNAKRLQDTRNALEKTIESAKATLKESDGQVQDEKTRDRLQTALDEAGAETDDVKALDKLKTALDKAIRAVDDSVAAYQDAMTAAAEAATVQASPQVQESYTPSYTYTSAPSSPSYQYGGGTAVAPSQTGGGNTGGGNVNNGNTGGQTGGQTQTGNNPFDSLPPAVGGDGAASGECVPVCIDGECQPCS